MKTLFILAIMILITKLCLSFADNSLKDLKSYSENRLETIDKIVE